MTPRDDSLNLPQFGRHPTSHGSTVGVVSWPNGNDGHSRRSSRRRQSGSSGTAGRPVGTVARELDLTETALRSWVRQAEIDAGRGSPGALTTEEREELGRLRRENRTLRMERDILKKATAFFAKENP